MEKPGENEWAWGLIGWGRGTKNLSDHLLLQGDPEASRPQHSLQLPPGGPCAGGLI